MPGWMRSIEIAAEQLRIDLPHNEIVNLAKALLRDAERKNQMCITKPPPRDITVSEADIHRFVYEMSKRGLLWVVPNDGDLLEPLRGALVEFLRGRT